MPTIAPPSTAQLTTLLTAPPESAVARPRRRQMRMALPGLGYVIVAGIVMAAAIIRDFNLLILLFAVMASLMLFSARFVVLTLRHLVPRRLLPERIVAGDTFDVRVEVQNRRKRGGSWMLGLVDEFERLAPGQPGRREHPATMLAQVPAHSKRTASYRLQLFERGKYRFGQLRLSSQFPLGLIERRVDFDIPGEMIVLPRIGRLTYNWQRRRRNASVGNRESERRHGVLEGDFYGLRPWRSGDSRRWIHWRTTARKGELMVRQFEQQRHQDITVLLELWQPVNPTPEERQHVELAVSFVATLVGDVCRRSGGQICVAATSKSFPLVRGPASTPLMYHILDSLAVAETHADDRLPELVRRWRSQQQRSSNVIVVSTRPVDLSDSTRFPNLSEDNGSGHWRSAALTVDSSHATFDQDFEID